MPPKLQFRAFGLHPAPASTLPLTRPSQSKKSFWEAGCANSQTKLNNADPKIPGSSEALQFPRVKTLFGVQVSISQESFKNKNQFGSNAGPNSPPLSIPPFGVLPSSHKTVPPFQPKVHPIPSKFEKSSWEEGCANSEIELNNADSKTAGSSEALQSPGIKTLFGIKVSISDESFKYKNEFGLNAGPNSPPISIPAFGVLPSSTKTVPTNAPASTLSVKECTKRQNEDHLDEGRAVRKVVNDFLILILLMHRFWYNRSMTWYAVRRSKDAELLLGTVTW